MTPADAGAAAAPGRLDRERLASPSWTPGRRDFPALVAALAEDGDELRAAVEVALERAGAGARDWLLRELPRVAPPARARVVRALGRLTGLPGDEALRDRLGELLGDEDARTRRAAAHALGRYDGDETERQLIAAFSRPDDPPLRRALVEALGKAGGAAARSFLAGLEASGDLELARRRDEALQRLGRRAGPAEAGAAPSLVDGERAAPGRIAVRLRCRAGVEEVLLEECPRAWRPRLRGPGLIDVELTGSLSSLFAVRTATGFGLPLAVDERDAGGVEALAERIAGAEAAALLEHFTVGPVRFRLEFPGGGKHRASVRRLVDGIAARRPGWINDPSERCWEIALFEREVDGAARVVGVELQPRLPDPRFAWRVAEVPAASHPTLAAALARVGGADPRDVVWDPFVGSAGELVERALLGPYRALHGGDLDDDALRAARANLAAAGVAGAQLVRAAALAGAPEGVTLVLTNPPMGRRVHRAADLADELDRFVEHVARVLVPGGRMAWLSPHGARTAEAAKRTGLAVELRRQVDMGGFPAELQRLRKPARRR